MSKADWIITITDRGRCEEFSAWFQEQGISLVLTTLGRGTATTEILDCLGLEDTEKGVLFCVAGQAHKLVRKAARELWLDVPGRGILMTVPLSGIGGAAARDYLLQQEEAEEPMERELTHELIVVITNQGYTDQVMDAARSAGARGGTVIHGLGTGSKNAEKFYKVSIAAEKEVILIVSAASQKAAIMKAIIEQAGPDTKAGAIAFSLPVSELAGFGIAQPSDR